jgi:RNA polymerase sigma factor (sigma-70 family)
MAFKPGSLQIVCGFVAFARINRLVTALVRARFHSVRERRLGCSLVWHGGFPARVDLAGMDTHPNQKFLTTVASLHGSQLTRFFASRLSDASEAPDLVQEVYLRILKLERPDLIRSPKAYLFRVAINVAREHWLKRSVRPPLVALDDVPAEALPVDTDAFSATGPEDAAVRTQRIWQLGTLLGQLSPKVRAALIWAHRDGHTYEEISAQLSVSPNRVKKYLTRALAHCRRNAIA